jgi:hypothetical protein
MNDTQIITLASILFPFIVSACAYLYKRFVPPSEAAKLEHAKSVVRTVVMGVEQTCSAMQGPDKKEEATRLITQLLNEVNIKPSPVLVSTLIEQAVYAINQGQDPQATQAVPSVSK